MEKLELKRQCKGHTFERCITSNPDTIKFFIKDYIFVKAIAHKDGTVNFVVYKHRKFEHETLIMRFV